VKRQGNGRSWHPKPSVWLEAQRGSASSEAGNKFLMKKNCLTELLVPLDEMGILTYDRSGHMSGQTMRRSEPKQRIASDAIYQSNGYDAYFGTFIVDEDKLTVTHHVEGGVARQLVGKDLVRSYSFDGDRLIFKATSPDEYWTVVFEKNRTY
jgi:hypothetical protein